VLSKRRPKPSSSTSYHSNPGAPRWPRRSGCLWFAQPARTRGGRGRHANGVAAECTTLESRKGTEPAFGKRSSSDGGPSGWRLTLAINGKRCRVSFRFFRWPNRTGHHGRKKDLDSWNIGHLYRTRAKWPLVLCILWANVFRPRNRYHSSFGPWSCWIGKCEEIQKIINSKSLRF